MIYPDFVPYEDPFADDEKFECCGQFYEDGRCCNQPYYREELESKDE